MILIFLRLLNKIGILKFLIFNIRTEVYSNTFSIPIIKGIGIKNIKSTESWMVGLLHKLIPLVEDKTFIDVGVNIGQTLLKLKSVSQKMNYIGFEPNPSAVFYTNELIKSNHFKNTSLVPIGLSNKTEVLTLKMYNKSDVDAAASILAEFRPNEKVIEEKIIPIFNVNELSDIRLRLENAGILKIDVEGAELEVLESLEKIIEITYPFILMEILPVYNTENTYRIERQEKIELILYQFNYIIYRIIKSNQNNTSIVFEKIESIGIHDDLNKCDYIFVPKDKASVFSDIIR